MTLIPFHWPYLSSLVAFSTLSAHISSVFLCSSSVGGSIFVHAYYNVLSAASAKCLEGVMLLCIITSKFCVFTFFQCLNFHFLWHRFPYQLHHYTSVCIKKDMLVMWHSSEVPTQCLIYFISNHITLQSFVSHMNLENFRHKLVAYVNLKVTKILAKVLSVVALCCGFWSNENKCPKCPSTWSVNPFSSLIPQVPNLLASVT